MKDALLQAIGVALDGLEVGYCAFDSDDRTLAWNKTFLSLFPEHDGRVHVGEGYADNLRRFYQTRLAPSEVGLIDQYIAEGVARHRTQRRPYEFDHGHLRIRVSSFEMGRFGRVRVWRQVGTLSNVTDRPAASSTQRLAELNAQAVLERLADGVVIVDVADCVMWANKTFLQLYDLSRVEDAVGTSFESIYRRAWAGREGDHAFAESMSTLRENQRFSGAPFVLALPADRYVRVIEQRGEFDGRGYFEHSDITHLKRQQIALAQAEKRYRLLAEFSSDIILSVEEGLITYASPALSELLGWNIEQVMGKPIVDFCHREDVPAIAQALQEIRGGRNQVDYRVRALHLDGSYVWVEARARHLPGHSGNLLDKRVINLRGIAARKAIEDELERTQLRLQQLAITDPLTGLANRRKLDETLAAECARSSRAGPPLSLLLLDIDHFKQFNDMHGHHVGDDVLKIVGAELGRMAQRAGDLAARLGGEEFVVLLPGADLTNATAKAEEVVRRVRLLELSSTPNECITVSVGVATYAGGSGDPQLLQRADAALYEAKRLGRNRVSVDTVSDQPTATASVSDGPHTRA
jgi:diguanylate cyclase (GGDEF)-like protein/PAS domain S-box-containing protein